MICGSRINSETSDETFAELRLRSIGFVFQSFNLIPSMSAEENVSLPMVLEGSRSRSEIHRRALELLDRVGLKDRSDHFPSMLSGGEQQRVTIARALANNCSLLCGDEPTGDLDTSNCALILSLLVDLNRIDGVTEVIVTHDQSLKVFAHRVVHVVDGKILRIETIDQSTRDQAVEELKKKVAEIKRNREEMKLSSEDSETFITPVSEIRNPREFYPYIVEQDERLRKKKLRQQQVADEKQAGIFLRN